VFGWSQKEKDAALIKALSGDQAGIEAVKEALGRGANVNADAGNGLSALGLAVTLEPESWALQAASLLIEKGANVNDNEDYYHRTPLYAALKDDSPHHISVLRKLLEAGADPNAECGRRGNALTVAAGAGFWDGVVLLIEHKADVSSGDDYGETLLMKAIDNDAPPELVRKIAEASDINAQEANPALHRAAAKEGTEMLALVLALPNVEVDLPDENGDTALLEAIRNRRDEAALMLIKAHADANKANDAGERPLTLAIEEGHEDVAEALLEAGASTDLGNKKGVAPLTLAAGQGSGRLVTAVLEAAKKAGDTPDLVPALISAAGEGHVQVLEALLAAGADPNAHDQAGRTPLMKAARANQTEALSLLIKAGAKPELADEEGQQAYDYAVKAKKKQAREYLARFRRDAPPAPKPAKKPTAPEAEYEALSKHTLEVREKGGLTMQFNFWTQQVIITTRGPDKKTNQVVQNFADLQRKEAIDEAYEKLKELGGDPPEPQEASLLKSAPGLTKNPGLNKR
jgi:ankyrin repeat protein